MHQSSFYTGVRFMLLLLFAIIVQGQTTTLPEAQEYTDGLFTDPIKLTLLGLQLTRSSICSSYSELTTQIRSLQHVLLLKTQNFRYILILGSPHHRRVLCLDCR